MTDEMTDEMEQQATLEGSWIMFSDWRQSGRLWSGTNRAALRSQWEDTSLLKRAPTSHEIHAYWLVGDRPRRDERLAEVLGVRCTPMPMKRFTASVDELGAPCLVRGSARARRRLAPVERAVRKRYLHRVGYVFLTRALERRPTGVDEYGQRRRTKTADANPPLTLQVDEAKALVDGLMSGEVALDDQRASVRWILRRYPKLREELERRAARERGEL